MSLRAGTIALIFPLPDLLSSECRVRPLLGNEILIKANTFGRLFFLFFYHSDENVSHLESLLYKAPKWTMQIKRSSIFMTSGGWPSRLGVCHLA